MELTVHVPHHKGWFGTKGGLEGPVSIKIVMINCKFHNIYIYITINKLILFKHHNHCITTY